MLIARARTLALKVPQVYYRFMRNLIGCLFLLTFGLVAQSNSEDEVDRAVVAKVTILLASHRDATLLAVSQRLADAILSAADRDHRPTRATVLRFAEELTNGLLSIQLPAKIVSQMSTSVVEVLGSAGVGTYRFKESVDRARQALITLGVADSNSSTLDPVRDRRRVDETVRVMRNAFLHDHCD